MQKYKADELIRLVNDIDAEGVRNWYQAHPGPNRVFEHNGVAFNPIRYACRKKSSVINTKILPIILEYTELNETDFELERFSGYFEPSLAGYLSNTNNFANDKNSQIIYGYLLKQFLSNQELPLELLNRVWAKFALTLLYPLVFERFPSTLLNLDSLQISYHFDLENNLKSLITQCDIIPNFDPKKLLRSYANLISLDKKRLWAMAIYSDPTEELINLMRPLLISKSYKYSLEERLFLNECAKHLKSFEQLKPYLTEYSDYYVINHPSVWLLFSSHLPEDLPKNVREFKRSDFPELFALMRWFMSKENFSEALQTNLFLLITLVKKTFSSFQWVSISKNLPISQSTGYEFLFYIIQSLVENKQLSVSKQSACIELLHSLTDSFEDVMWWILAHLYKGKVIPTAWPFRNEKSCKQKCRNYEEFQNRFPLLEYFLTRSNKNLINVSAQQKEYVHSQKNDDKHSTHYFLFWFERYLSKNLKKYGIAETVVPQDYDPQYGLKEYEIANQNFTMLSEHGLFYDPIHLDENPLSLYPPLQELTFAEFKATLENQTHYATKTPLIRLFYSEFNSDSFGLSWRLVRELPMELRSKLLLRNPHTIAPLHAILNLLSPSERYKISQTYPDVSEKNSLGIIRSILSSSPRSYLTSSDERTLLVNCVNRLKDVKVITPYLNSIQDFLVFDHCDLWLELVNHIPTDMQEYAGNDIYIRSNLEFFVYAKWWTAQNGNHAKINIYLERLSWLIKNKNLMDLQSRQHFFELLCFAVRTLLNKEEKRSQIRDGSRKILTYFAEVYPAFHWLLAKMYEGKLLTPTLFRNYDSHRFNFSHTKDIFFDKLTEFLPLLNSVLLNRHREQLAPRVPFEPKRIDLLFLEWLEYFILFNLNQFGIDQSIVAKPYPNLNEPNLRARFETLQANDLFLGRSDGLFSSLPDLNQPAQIPLEIPLASAPPESVLPSLAASTVTSRAASPTLSRRNSTQTDATFLMLQQASEKLSESDYADVSHINILATNDSQEDRDDLSSSDSIEEPIILNSPDEKCDVEIVVVAEKSIALEDIEEQLQSLVVETADVIFFPDAPIHSLTESKIAVPDTSHWTPSTVTKPAENSKMYFFPELKDEEPLPQPPQDFSSSSSSLFFASAPSNEQPKQTLNEIDRAFAEESANLAALAKVTGHDETIHPLMQKILQRLNELFVSKTELMQEAPAKALNKIQGSSRDAHQPC